MDMDPYNNSKENVIRRLKKIEGQVKGLQRMVENDKCCVDVLVQVAAIRSAIHKVGTIVFENYSRVCLSKAAENDKDKALEELIGILAKFIK